MSKRLPLQKPPSHWLLTTCVGFVLGLATLILNDVPELRIASPDGRWPPSLAARVLTVPIALTGTSDLRWFAIPLGLALGLAICAIGRPALKQDAEDGARASASAGVAGAWWFELLASFVLVIAIASAWANRSWDISRGWIFWLCCGIGWAILLRWAVHSGAARKLIFLASIIAAAGSVLTIWHRLAMGEPFMELPIGPTTITAGLGVLWSSIASALLLCICFEPQARRGFSIPGVLWIALSLLLSLVLAVLAARRGAWIGFVAAVAVVLSLLVWRRGKHRVLLVGGVIALCGLMLVGGIYLLQTIVDPRTNLARSILGRTRYLREATAMVPDALWMGHGPDTFVFGMTDSMARLRAEQPRWVRGAVDYDAHNEWIQAAYELGVPGGLLYLALPLTVIWLGCRRWHARPHEPENVILLALCAGLTAIVATEAASINLRHPILSAWYWTLLGLGLALLRRGVESTGGPMPQEAGRSILLRGCGFACACGIVALSVSDLRRGMQHESGRLLMDEDTPAALAHMESATGRFGSRNWLWIRYDAATLHSNELRGMRRETASQPASGEREVVGRLAIAAWQELWSVCRGYRDVGYRLAEAQFLAGQREASELTLGTFIGEINPYDRAANLLQIHMGGRSAFENLHAVRRALRSSPLDSTLVSFAMRELGHADTQAPWAGLVKTAEADAAREDDASWEDPLSPETLRLEALRHATQSRMAEAARCAQLSSAMYDRLVNPEKPARRPRVVEADAMYLAARLLFDHAPGEYQRAFAYMLRAEEASQLEVTVTPETARGLMDLDPVALRKRTAELRQLLRFSAQMHLVVGADMREVARRANWSLPGSRHTQAQVDAEVGVMAAELVDAFSRLPEERQPPTYRQLFDLARRAMIR